MLQINSKEFRKRDQISQHRNDDVQQNSAEKLWVSPDFDTTICQELIPGNCTHFIWSQ